MTNTEFAAYVAEQLASEMNSGSAVWDEAGGPEAVRNAGPGATQFLLVGVEGRAVITVRPEVD